MKQVENLNFMLEKLTLENEDLVTNNETLELELEELNIQIEKLRNEQQEMTAEINNTIKSKDESFFFLIKNSIKQFINKNF